MYGWVTKIKTWLQRNYHFAWVAKCLIIAASSYYVYLETKVGLHLRESLELSTDFSVRSWLGLSPVISPNLKIIAFDDPTADFTGAAELPANDLERILLALRKRGPYAVLIPRLFTFGAADKSIVSRLMDSKADDTVVAAACFLSNTPITGRTPLETSRAEFALNTYGLDYHRAKNLFPDGPDFIYGPHPSYRSVFDRIGHTGLEEDGARFEPFVRTGQNVVPHLSVYAAQNVNFKNNVLTINDQPVTTPSGKLLTNFLDHEAINSNKYSIKSVLNRLDAGKTLRGLNQGDVIIILPSETTGSTVSLNTPAGKMLQSSVFVSQVNSMMTGRFIYTLPGLFGFFILASALGLWVGSLTRSTQFISVLALLGSLISILGVMMFAYFDLDSPWLMCTFTVVVAGFIRHARIASKSEMRARVLKQALHRMISDDKIDQLAENPGLINLAPQEQNITILFFDLVSFSLVSEGRDPKELFEELKIILNLICECVHEHDGIVDKILGDGALCLFGVTVSNAKVAKHAELAVECAVKIQRRMLARNLSLPQGHISFPVRVGVHTTSAFMGDLGHGDKIEFTVIGPGVNFAKRLEEACEPYRIMISASTLANLSFDQSKIMPQMVRRDIGIKHHDELFEAYEIHAFMDQNKDLGEALKRHNSMLGRQRLDERFLFPEGRELRVKFPMGTAVIKDFSSTGVRVTADFYIASGFQTVMTFECDSSAIRTSLIEHHVQQVQVVVRWGKPLPDGSFALGLQYVGMQQDVRDILIEILRRYNEDLAHATIRGAI